MEALKNGKNLEKIYRGGVLIWKKPKVYVAINPPSAGYNNLTADIYPIRSNITYKLMRDGKVIDEKKTTTMKIKFTGYFKTNIESGDRVVITASAKGFISTTSDRLVP